MKIEFPSLILRAESEIGQGSKEKFDRSREGGAMHKE